MEYENELYIDIDINSSNHRITVKHSKTICDAQILLDDQAVKTSLKTLAYGGAFIFSYDDTQIIITISDNNPKNSSDKENYSYDCFVDGISVKNGAPFEVNGYTFTKALSWKQKRLANKNKYILVEALKGIIAGCVIFLALYFVQYISTAFYHIFDAHWGIFMIASLVLPTALFAIIAVGDYKKNEAAYNEYKKYLEK